MGGITVDVLDFLDGGVHVYFMGLDLLHDPMGRLSLLPTKNPFFNHLANGKGEPYNGRSDAEGVYKLN